MKNKPKRPVRVGVHLPKTYPWKVLQALVEDLKPFLIQDDIDLITQIMRDRDFSSYQILSDMWGLQNQSMAHLAPISQFRARYQIASALKKFQFDTDRNDRIETAKKKFLAAETSCGYYNSKGVNLLLNSGSTSASILTYARSFVQKVLNGLRFPSKEVIVDWSRHGPGNNLDTCKGRNNIYYKYENWPYSCTQAALPYARFLIQTDARWRGALENSYRERFNIPKHSLIDQEVFWSKVFKVVEGNRITFVPKNALTERTIAIEPTMNLMLQLGVDGVIRKRLKRWGVDLDSQVKNQRFAYQGSLHPTKYATIDLAAASDSISLAVCRHILPDDLYNYLLKLRSPKGTMGGQIFQYEKLSSMGNGYTFAIESLIFAALCYATLMHDKGYADTHKDFAVFGDDLIIGHQHITTLFHALKICGFEINREKSFFEGFNRESCGTDWVQGKSVRPVFLKKIPADIMDLFTDLNRFKRILDLRFGIEESNLERLFIKWIPSCYKQFVGPISDEEFSTYRHVRKPLVSWRWSDQSWRYPILVKGLNVAKGRKDFFFQKLMHDLRDRPIPLQFRKKLKVDTGGSRFTVFKSYSYTVHRSTSVANFWRSTYAEPIPSRSE